MKNPFKFLLFTVFLFIPAAVFAQGSGSYEPSAPRPQTAESLRTESNFVVTRSVTGTIVSLKDGVLTIKTDKNKEIQVGILKSTQFKIGKKKVDNSELEDKLFDSGNSVKITYQPFEDKRVDKVALEIRFAENKDKEKPVIG